VLVRVIESLTVFIFILIILNAYSCSFSPVSLASCKTARELTSLYCPSCYMQCVFIVCKILSLDNNGGSLITINVNKETGVNIKSYRTIFCLCFVHRYRSTHFSVLTIKQLNIFPIIYFRNASWFSFESTISMCDISYDISWNIYQSINLLINGC